MDHGKIWSLTRSTDDLHAKKQKHMRPLSPFWSADDDIPSPPRSTNNPRMKTKKRADPTSSSQSTDDDATLPPPRMKKQDCAIVPPPHVNKNMPKSRPRPVSPMDSNIPSPPKRRQATNNPGRGNHHTGSPNNAGSVHDVLEDHHRKNHCPRTPDSDRLKNLRRQAAGESSANEEDKRLKPLGFIPTLGKTSILPSDIDDDKEFEDYVSQQVMKLLNGGYFLQNSVDEQGRTNNLAHDVLGELCSTIFYKGDNALAKAFPNVFAEAVPEGAVALAATAVGVNPLPSYS
ncbi:hypothetical protein EV424DRAFT_1611846 [Suillus variegatus]|nr:hypothetical protein EV424DRAFT_1611846 [Suillus variegatus]